MLWITVPSTNHPSLFSLSLQAIWVVDSALVPHILMHMSRLQMNRRKTYKLHVIFRHHQRTQRQWLWQWLGPGAIESFKSAEEAVPALLYEDTIMFKTTLCTTIATRHSYNNSRMRTLVTFSPPWLCALHDDRQLMSTANVVYLRPQALTKYFI